MSPRLQHSKVLVALAALLAGCGEAPATAGDDPSESAETREGLGDARLQFGAPARVGNGNARSYVALSRDGNPVEVGVALDSAALDGLPSTGMEMYRLDLPAGAPAPYRHLMVEWNATGHEPETIYDVPHFDFHFYFVTPEEVAAISPEDPEFATRANNLPEGEHVPEFMAVLGPPGADAASVAVPEMGVHWTDVRSPELQGMAGNPEAFRPFTKTFIYGSWNGRMIFLEPMITRDYLLTRPDEVVPIPQPARVPEPGWYPDAYRITYDPQAKEYRVALTGLSRRE